MKSIEKRMFLLLGLSLVSGLSMMQVLPLEDPHTVKDVAPLILCIWWGILSLAGAIASFIILLVRGFIRLKLKYRDRVRAYKQGLPTKFPQFFQFMTWLNTDD